MIGLASSTFESLKKYLIAKGRIPEGVNDSNFVAIVWLKGNDDLQHLDYSVKFLAENDTPLSHISLTYVTPGEGASPT